MYVFILQERKTIVAIQLRKSPGKTWNFIENPGSFMQNLLEKVEKSPGKSWNSVENPGTFMQNLLEKMEKSPGKSWNLNQFFWWQP